MKTMKNFLTAVMAMMFTVSFGQETVNGDTTIFSDTFIAIGGNTSGDYKENYEYLPIDSTSFNIDSVTLIIEKDSLMFYPNIDTVNYEGMKVEMSIDTNNTIIKFSMLIGASFYIDSTKIYYSYKSSNTTSTLKYNIKNDFKAYSYNKTIKVETTETTPYEIYIHNLSGRTIYKGSSNGNFSKRLNEPNGIYLVNVVTDKGRLSKKVVLR